jgi:hypothetical protein
VGDDNRAQRERHADRHEEREQRDADEQAGHGQRGEDDREQDTAAGKAMARDRPGGGRPDHGDDGEHGASDHEAVQERVDDAVLREGR